MMDKKKLHKLLNKAIAIGMSSRHYVDFSYSPNIPPSFYIHRKKNNVYNGVEDSIMLHEGYTKEIDTWLDYWKNMLDKEREEDDTN